VAAIRDAGAHYLISLKANQPTLYTAAQHLAETAQPHSAWEETERTRDRVTTRSVRVFPVPAQEPFTLWRDLACIVAVERHGTRGSEPVAHQAWFISSQTLPAEELAAAIRGRWAIENGLHWTKDSVLQEDAYATRAGHAPKNWALLLNLVVTLFHLHGHSSITSALRRFAHDIPALFKLLLVE
jgi:predicted transposase YbfD/YdcC